MEQFYIACLLAIAVGGLGTALLYEIAKSALETTCGIRLERQEVAEQEAANEATFVKLQATLRAADKEDPAPGTIDAEKRIPFRSLWTVEREDNQRLSDYASLQNKSSIGDEPHRDFTVAEAWEYVERHLPVAAYERIIAAPCDVQIRFGTYAERDKGRTQPNATVSASTIQNIYECNVWVWPNAEIEDVIHEFGHVFARVAQPNLPIRESVEGPPESQAEYKRQGRAWVNDPQSQAWRRNEDDIDLEIARWTGAAKYFISPYAASDPGEFFAECFAAYCNQLPISAKAYDDEAKTIVNERLTAITKEAFTPKGTMRQRLAIVAPDTFAWLQANAGTEFHRNRRGVK